MTLSHSLLPGLFLGQCNYTLALTQSNLYGYSLAQVKFSDIIVKAPKMLAGDYGPRTCHRMSVGPSQLRERCLKQFRSVSNEESSAMKALANLLY